VIGRTGYEIREGSQMIRDRIRAAVGPCAGVDRERHAELVAAVVEQARLHSPANARARRIAGQRKRDGLETEGR